MISLTDTVAQRPRARRAAALPAARSICAISQPPKMSPAAFVSPGIAMVRTATSVENRASASSRTAAVADDSSFESGISRSTPCRRASRSRRRRGCGA